MSEDDVRTYADERRRILVELERERNQLVRNIETCRIRDIERPFIGDWSLKDIVGHVSSWEAEVIVAFRQLRDGQNPDLLRFDPARVDEWNRDHVERKRSLNFWDVYQQLRAGRERLLRQLSEMSDEDVGAEGTVGHRILQATIDHDRTHWHDIAAKLAGMPGARPPAEASIPADAAQAARR